MTNRFVEVLFRSPIHALKVSNTPLTSGKNQVGPDTLSKHGHGLSSPCRHILQACHAILLWAWQTNHSQSSASRIKALTKSRVRKCEYPTAHATRHAYSFFRLGIWRYVNRLLTSIYTDGQAEPYLSYPFRPHHLYCPIQQVLSSESHARHFLQHSSGPGWAKFKCPLFLFDNIRTSPRVLWCTRLGHRYFWTSTNFPPFSYSSCKNTPCEKPNKTAKGIFIYCNTDG